MKLVASVLKYLAIGICLGIGILIVDQLYFKYGNPQQVVIMEELMEELVDLQLDPFDWQRVIGSLQFSFRVFDNEVRLEESCVVNLRERPGFWCHDDPHATRGGWSGADELEERIANIERIALQDSFVDTTRAELRVVQWFTDPEKLRAVFEEMRTEPLPEPQGVRIEFPDLPPRFSALLCDDAMCLTLSSGSRTKVKGLIAQILEGREG